jgi:hypothetical protein
MSSTTNCDVRDTKKAVFGRGGFCLVNSDLLSDT